MNIKSDIPQILLLRKHLEKSIDFPLNTHGDILKLSAGIEFTLREHISESTLEGMWGYSTRGYETENSTMQKGDTFSCLQFQKGKELHLDDFRKSGFPEKFRYVVGMNNGLTALEIISPAE